VAALGNEHQDLGAALKSDATSPDFPLGAAKDREVTNGCLNMPTEANGVIAVSSVGPSGKKSDFSNHGLERTTSPRRAASSATSPARSSPSGRNMILGPYPKNVALANGDVDPTTGKSLSSSVIAECSASGIDSCAYYQFIQAPRWRRHTLSASPH